RETAERRAINMPIQGTAAELIKIAMIEIDRSLRAANNKSRMLMQVHDELVFEVHTSEIDSVPHLIREKMEQAVELDVPILVDMAWGKNWAEAH
ncbi:DNA polymerase, partial [candidate division CSSED10-310 bacterium]